MPVSIASVQKAYTFQDGEDAGNFIEFGESAKAFEQFGITFLKNLSISANKKKVVGSGALLRDAKYRFSDDGTTMQIMMPDYFDYPNEGVKGVKSSRNAPNSPYQYKTYGMSQQGRSSIKKYIESGRAKISTVRKDKALGIGLESKNLSLIDSQVNTMVYMIKKYGLKKTDYFNDAIKETFKDFEFKMSEALGRDIVFTLEKINRK